MYLFLLPHLVNRIQIGPASTYMWVVGTQVLRLNSLTACVLLRLELAESRLSFIK